MVTRQMNRMLQGILALGMGLIVSAVSASDRIETGPLLAQINAVGSHGQGHRGATTAWRKLASADAEQIPEILAAVEPKNVLATNWIRAAVESIAERSLRDGGEIPQVALQAFLNDARHAPRARRLAYELLLRADPNAESRLNAGLLNDPSIELRRDAVAAAFEAAQRLEGQGDATAARGQYRTVFRAARDVDQVKQLAEKLRKFNESVDLPSHFGFVMDWYVIAPFDNRNRIGFDTAYPPEGIVDLKGTFDGKDNAKIGWLPHTTSDDFGLVDLTKAIDKHKGAIAYAYHEFTADQEQPIEIRIGSTNANKVWLNGELLTANHVYHAGRDVDQYSAPGRLRAGKNKILVKIAQNEQSEPWAEDWQFQLRVCDEIGTAVLAKDRKPTATSGSTSGS